MTFYLDSPVNICMSEILYGGLQWFELVTCKEVRERRWCTGDGAVEATAVFNSYGQV